MPSLGAHNRATGGTDGNAKNKLHPPATMPSSMAELEGGSARNFLRWMKYDTVRMAISRVHTISSSAC